ncbi:PP2C family protein-serine/threonine phosphatase [Photobacterium aphoticum]|uniref:Regulator n=1 Tax=Photobacterium aphoticum TaxID=754436 RepID=A0A0J1GUQ5_9GAMM|nr:SpoIIE family protein phosphatase [Photobacterium aphoticum]KLV03159.1 regulator [Photobacterium aphoticum]PSU56550.1 regulator [Photobacterium aphoticum]
MPEILLVDDNRTMLLLLKTQLMKRGYRITTANDGAQALQILEAREDIQFVLSDWMMPGIDGIELCRRVKSAHYARYLFFVLLSGKDDQQSIIDGINAGADDFVVKDTHIDELVARIQAGFRTLALHNEITSKNTQLDKAYATIKKDLESAGDLLRRLLPQEKKLIGVELSYVSIPSAQIGGDMLGYMQLDEEHVAFYLLDVAGHGVSSALMSFSVQQSISVSSDKGAVVKTSIPEPPYYRLNAPHEVLARLNDLYLSGAENMLYFTMAYATLNVKTGQLAFAVAGHPPLVWLHSQTGEAEFIGQDSFVVGAFDFAEYETSYIQLEPGDKVWIYSDGITEAENGAMQFSEPRFKDLVVTLKDHPTAVQTELLVKRVREWQQADNFDDDISVMAVEWTGYPEGEQACNMRLSTKVSAQFYK